MKKGFTLIELLAVIVILAIIAVIAVPIVLNIIDESKKNTILRSAEMYVDVLEQAILRKNVKLTESSMSSECEVLNNGSIDCNGKIIVVELSGKAPESGIIKISNGNITGLNIEIEGKEIYKNSKGELVYAKFLDEVCEFKSGIPKTAGAKYLCKVDPNKDHYTFYVLTTPEEDTSNINLIMDRNICSDGSFATSTNTCLISWTSWDYLEKHAPQENLNNRENLNIYGPVTAMEYLSNGTKTWTNTNCVSVSS